eukprot:4943171-Prymnesium_polylepis.1
MPSHLTTVASMYREPTLTHAAWPAARFSMVSGLKRWKELDRCWIIGGSAASSCGTSADSGSGSGAKTSSDAGAAHVDGPAAEPVDLLQRLDWKDTRLFKLFGSDGIAIFMAACGHAAAAGGSGG